MSEGLFAGCCTHGIQLPDDLCLIEPVVAGGWPAAPGSPAQRLYVTNLYNHALPLVRFEVTDELTESRVAAPADPGCGGSRTRRAVSMTRSYTAATSPSTRTCSGSALARHPQVLEYQVRQTEQDADIRLVAPAGLDAPALRRKAEELLTGIGLHEPAVTVTLTASLDRAASGKLKRFVPLPG